MPLLMWMLMCCLAHHFTFFTLLIIHYFNILTIVLTVRKVQRIEKQQEGHVCCLRAVNNWGRCVCVWGASLKFGKWLHGAARCCGDSPYLPGCGIGRLKASFTQLGVRGQRLIPKLVFMSVGGNIWDSQLGDLLSCLHTSVQLPQRFLNIWLLL